MTAVYIIAGILLFFFIILIIPVKVALDFSGGEFSFVLYYGLIKVFDSKKPRKEKPEKDKPKDKEKSGQDKKEGKKPSEIQKLFEHKKEKLGFGGAVRFFLGIIGEIFGKLVWVIKKIKFRKFRLNLVVASDDAATTAINYGAFCAGIYPLLSFLSSNTNLTLKEVNISADYNKTAIDLDLSIFLKTRIIYFLVLAIEIFVRYKKLIKEVKEDE